VTAGDLPILSVEEGLQNLLVKTLVRDRGMERLEAILPDYIKEQRWFGGKEAEIHDVAIEDAVRLQTEPPVYLSILRVHQESGSDLYLMPLTLSEEEDAEEILESKSHAALAWVDGPRGRSLLHDAVVQPAFWLRLFRWWQSGGRGRSLQGTYQTDFDEAVQRARIDQVRIFSGEQSNSSALLGDQFYAKLYRRMEEGVNPEIELLAHLTDVDFRATPALRGSLSFQRGHDTFTMGVLQDALPVETDGWTYAREMAARFLDRIDETPPPQDGHPKHYADDPPAWLDDIAPEIESLARALGVRTAAMHRALARAEAPDLRPEPGSPEDTEALIDRVGTEADQTRSMLAHLDTDLALPDEADWNYGLERLGRLTGTEATRQKIRVHGDYHLGQVVRADGEFYILDFEGEPARSLEARRKRDYALRDVAGMLRSLEYAVLSAWQDRIEAHDSPPDHLEDWSMLIVEWCEAAFMDAYYSTAEEEDFLLPREARLPFLWAYLLDKALYEVRYELNHRPDWVWLPVRGLLRLLRPLEAEDAETLAAPGTW
jgi:maltose alpha-D-glucosyltransferase/alpha-amylase